MKKLVLAACSLLFVLTAQAQTGRIAHFSHGGSAATLAEADDNLGLSMTSYWKADTLVYLNDSTVLHKGLCSRSYYGPPAGRAGWHRQVEQEPYFRYQYRQVSSAERMENLRREYPQAVFVGFERLRQSAPKKPAGRNQTFPKRPFQYSYWRSLAGVVALGAVGWLLGKKRVA